MHIQAPRSLIATPLAWLPFTDDIRSSRLEFFDSLHDLPKQLRQHLAAFHAARLHRSSDRPLLGEALPWLFGDFLGVTSNSNFRIVARAWFSIYYAVILTDDLLDRKNDQVSHSILTSNLLFIRGLSDLFSVSNNPKRLKKICDRGFSQCAQTAYIECAARERGGLGSTQTSIKVIERKFAVAQICFAALLELKPIGNYSFHVRKANTFLRQLMLGLQLLDDLCDWSEDLASSHFTFPLLHAIHRNSSWRDCIRKHSNIEEDIVFILLVQTGAISETLLKAREAIALFLSHFTDNSQARKSVLYDTFYKANKMVALAHKSSEILREKIIRTYPLDMPLPTNGKEVIAKIHAKKEYLDLRKKLMRITAHT